MTDTTDSSRLSIAPHDVHVWYICPEPTLSPMLVRQYEALLSPDERVRYERFVFAADRLRFLAARVLVRTTLSRYAAVAPGSWTFSTASFGRPEIAGPAGAPRLRFNLSHTHGLVVLAVAANADVGIDVERVVDRVGGADIARRFFAGSEADMLDSVPAERRSRIFLEYWTLKEAYIKAIGVGLSAALQSFAFELSTPPTITFEDPAADDASSWQFTQLDLSPDHVAALATRHRRAPIVSCRPVALVGAEAPAVWA